MDTDLFVLIFSSNESNQKYPNNTLTPGENDHTYEKDILFADRNNILSFYTCETNVYIAPITLCEDSNIVLFELGYRTNKCIVGDKMLIEDWIVSNNLNKCVSQNGLILNVIPNHMRSFELCEIAVRQNPRAIQFVPPQYQDAKPLLYKLILKENGTLLKSIPMEERTQELCSIAVHQNVFALQSVPSQYLTEEFMLLAISRELDREHCPIFEMVAELYATPTVCRAAVLRHPMALQWVPKHLLTAELCNLAILTNSNCNYNNNGNAIRYIPPEFQTPEMCKIAVSWNAMNLEWVSVQTPELCKFAISMCSQAFTFVKNKTGDILLAYRQKLEKDSREKAEAGDDDW